MFEKSIHLLKTEIASEKQAQKTIIGILPDGETKSILAGTSDKRIQEYEKTIEVLENLPTVMQEYLHANDCPECHVSLNKDGKCPSCEQDHADNVREAGQGK